MRAPTAKAIRSKIKIKPIPRDFDTVWRNVYYPCECVETIGRYDGTRVNYIDENNLLRCTFLPSNYRDRDLVEKWNEDIKLGKPIGFIYRGKNKTRNIVEVFEYHEEVPDPVTSLDDAKSYLSDIHRMLLRGSKKDPRKTQNDGSRKHQFEHTDKEVKQTPSYESVNYLSAPAVRQERVFNQGAFVSSEFSPSAPPWAETTATGSKSSEPLNDNECSIIYDSKLKWETGINTTKTIIEHKQQSAVASPSTLQGNSSDISIQAISTGIQATIPFNSSNEMTPAARYYSNFPDIKQEPMETTDDPMTEEKLLQQEEICQDIPPFPQENNSTYHPRWYKPPVQETGLSYGSTNSSDIVCAKQLLQMKEEPQEAGDDDCSMYPEFQTYEADVSTAAPQPIDNGNEPENLQTVKAEKDDFSWLDQLLDEAADLPLRQTVYYSSSHI